MSELDFGGAVENQKDNVELTQKGVWVTGKELGLKPNPDGSDTRYLVRSTYRTNTDYVQAQAEWRRKHGGENGVLEMDEWQVAEMLRYAFAKGCVRGWENVQNTKGKPIEFDGSLIHEYRKCLPHLFDKLGTWVGKRSRQEEAAAEALVGE